MLECVKNLKLRILQSTTIESAMMANRPGHGRKVSLPVPSKFNGNIGDYIDNWNDQYIKPDVETLVLA
jgi:hypothetical protein